MRLPVLAKPSLQYVFERAGPDQAPHELLVSHSGRAVLGHLPLKGPQQVSHFNLAETLDQRSFWPLYEVTDEEARLILLHVLVVTLGRASGSSAGDTYCARSLLKERSSTRALDSIQVHQERPSYVEPLVLFIFRWLQSIKDFIAPFNIAKVVYVLIAAGVADSQLASRTVLEGSNVRHQLLHVGTARCLFSDHRFKNVLKTFHREY